jgi:endonuclease III
MENLNLKEISDLLDKEANYYEKKRKNLTNTKDVLRENYDNEFAHYAQCCRELKSSFLLLIVEKEKIK